MGFSDHAPYRNGDAPGERMRVEELADYVSSVRKLQHTYQDQIEIRLGMEIEYFEEQLDELMQYKEEMDYLILGRLPAGEDHHLGQHLRGRVPPSRITTSL